MLSNRSGSRRLCSAWKEHQTGIRRHSSALDSYKHFNVTLDKSPSFSDVLFYFLISKVTMGPSRSCVLSSAVLLTAFTGDGEGWGYVIRNPWQPKRFSSRQIYSVDCSFSCSRKTGKQIEQVWGDNLGQHGRKYVLVKIKDHAQKRIKNKRSHL